MEKEDKKKAICEYDFLACTRLVSIDYFVHSTYDTGVMHVVRRFGARELSEVCSTSVQYEYGYNLDERYRLIPTVAHLILECRGRACLSDIVAGR